MEAACEVIDRHYADRLYPDVISASNKEIEEINCVIPRNRALLSGLESLHLLHTCSKEEEDERAQMVQLVLTEHKPFISALDPKGAVTTLSRFIELLRGNISLFEIAKKEFIEALPFYHECLLPSSQDVMAGGGALAVPVASATLEEGLPVVCDACLVDSAKTKPHSNSKVDGSKS